MDHVAIMNKKWKLIEKILSREKTIESRWYLSKKSPFGKIKPGDTIYFKNSGEPVTAKAKAKEVFQFENLSSKSISKILDKYNNQIWSGPKEEFFEMVKSKKYFVLISLTDPQLVEPFNINKKGFGISVAWLTTQNINNIKN
jgi:ASC-1-like (ASCH) protein